MEEVNTITMMGTYVGLLTLSTTSSFVTMFTAFESKRIRHSTVQYVTFSIFFCDCFWSFMRLVLYSIGISRKELPTSNSSQRTYSSDHPIEGFCTILGDLFIIASAWWIILSTYEMRRLILKSMARSADKERFNIVLYSALIYIPLIVYFIVFTVYAALNMERKSTNLLLISIQAVVWSMLLAVIYPAYTLVRIHYLKKGRHGFLDPGAKHIYYRVKFLVAAFIVLQLPCSVVSFVSDVIKKFPSIWFFITNCVFYLTGFIDSIVIGGSFHCVVRILQPILPNELHEQLIESGRKFTDSVMGDEELASNPPLIAPVFVCTDIQSSTYLWSEVPKAMSKAHSLHDDCLRQHLHQFRGYEITTCGDAFQLAFHTSMEAISYCIYVQKSLIELSWPKDLENYPCSKSGVDSFGRYLFKGLRVRMAIHVGDEQLIIYIHPITGKLTYSGLSEIVAREIGSLGHGGQILCSQSTIARLQTEMASDAIQADILRHHDKRITMSVLNKDFITQEYGAYEIEDLRMSISLQEIIIQSLKTRFNTVEDDQSITIVRKHHNPFLGFHSNNR